MGLLYDPTGDSPPNPTPRRLSETNAATTLAFFKQQNSPQLAPIATPRPIQPPLPLTNAPNHPEGGTFRKKQKYTIKNVEAWGERHGRPAQYDPNGRALWKRTSDGRLVYLDCPAPGCGKSDFVTLHGFMCHLTKKHKDRSLGSQSRALDLCGTVYDPNAPRPASHPTQKRAQTEDSQQDSMTEAGKPYPMELSSSSDDDGDGEGEEGKLPHPLPKKPRVDSINDEHEAAHPPLPFPTPDGESSPRILGPLKPTIATMIDSGVESDHDRQRQPMMPTPPIENGHSSAFTTTHAVSKVKTEGETHF